MLADIPTWKHYEQNFRLFMMVRFTLVLLPTIIEDIFLSLQGV